MNETLAQLRGAPCSSWARTLEALTVSQGQHRPRAACGNEPEILPGGHPRGWDPVGRALSLGSGRPVANTTPHKGCP